jgi:hypothetical protein
MLNSLKDWTRAFGTLYVRQTYGGKEVGRVDRPNVSSPWVWNVSINTQENLVYRYGHCYLLEDAQKECDYCLIEYGYKVLDKKFDLMK